MDALKKRRSTIKGQMTKIIAFAETIKPETKVEEIRARLDKTTTLWNDFAKTESEMFEVNCNAESQTDEFDESYYHAVALLNASLRQPHVTQLNTSMQNGEGSFQMVGVETKLPRLHIPIFQGHYQEWQSFFDLFNSSIHEKTSITGAQKLQHLKSLLKGEPLGLIRHLSVTDANYIEAYQILSKRYDKRKNTINSYIESFLNQPPITRVNSSNIRTLANTSEEIIRGLKAVGTQGELRDPWLIFLIVSKLDDQSRQFWQHQSAKIDHPKLQELIDCLHIRADSLEGVHETIVKPKSQGTTHVKRTYTAVSTHTIICPLCNIEHLLYQCDKFKEMSITERRNYINQNSRCYNCLSDTHSVQSCRSKRSCQICRKRHNSLLHVPNVSKPNQTESQLHTVVHSAHTTYDPLPSNCASSTKPITPKSTHSSNMNSVKTISPLNHAIDTSNESLTKNVTHLNSNPINPPSINNTSSINTHPNNLPLTNQLPCNQIPIELPTNTIRAAINRSPHTKDLAPINQLSSVNNQYQQHVTNNYEAILSKTPDTNLSPSLLPTALVNVKDNSGQMHCCRILLDSGSEASFVTASCVKRLGLPTEGTNVKIRGVGASSAGTARACIRLSIYSRCNPNSSIFVKAFILPKVAMPLPSSSLCATSWNHLKSLQLADPHFNETSSIDILIGATHFFDIIQDGKIYGETGLPIAQNSIFGWVIAGSTYLADPVPGTTTISLVSEIDINQTLQRFWETEEVPSTIPLTNDEELCEKHFDEFQTRSPEGRFIVRLPFKPTKTELGNSFNMALRRFLTMENRLQRDPKLQEEYVTFMREYERLGHMKRIPPEQITIDSKTSFYLPHHAVIKQSSTTTKVRVVFDASAKTSNNLSLNDNLLVGPTVQDTLYAILVRFRKHPIVFTADIEKMYRQIAMDPADTEYQRIIWREHPAAPIEHYRLVTVTYGTASAPYLATKTLTKLAEEFREQYPIASKIVREDLYIDDLMSGANTEDDAITLKEQVVKILESGCFHLRKWTSNCPSLLNTIPVENREEFPVKIREENRSIKILGLEWNPQADNFHFKVSISAHPTMTKRGMLSEASKIFDPIGWLSPSTVMIKILFQSLWLLNLQWDDSLPTHITKRWIALRNELPELEKISIPRWLHIKESDFQLHGFADASEVAYSAVIYARTRNKNGSYETTIVTAKTKVAPIKSISVPRLELCAALLLTRLMKTVVKCLQCPAADVFTWTDSTTVLWWLSTHPRSWKSYVANRTSEILETTSRSTWRYVPTKENPADCASRGILPSTLTNFELWWKGPSWLREDKELWPDQQYLQYTADNSESKISTLTNYHVAVENKFLADLAQRYFKFSKLIRIVARIFQFYFNLRRARTGQSKEELLSTNDFKIASERIIKWAQMDVFAAEIKNIKQQKSLPSSSKLIQLNPFLDQCGVLRVGSRIRNANVQYDVKFPIILPANHIVTDLIIDETHLKYLHASQSVMITTIRQKYWIINCKTLVRQRIYKCIPCTRYKASKQTQLMGELPPERVNFKYAFYQTGVDYAGPIWLKSMTGRKSVPHKAYIAIFVCLSSKAVHLELVSDLTTEAFIASLKRFMARRGVSADMFSDNGTNFVGAKNTFAEIQKLKTSKTHNQLISNFLLDFNTKWHFIPASAPSFGGLWEAAVKSTKYHIRRVLGTTLLNFEEMSTFLSQIEAILNSRPLCLLAPQQEDALTPAHFLIGQPLTMLPDPDYKPLKQNRLSRWQLIQNLMQHFWTRWHKEYLTTLHNRSKWQHKHKNLKVNDVVLIRDDNIPPAKWILGRIIETHPGTDGLVRVVTLRTKAGIIKRPIAKLVSLPVF